MTCWFIKVHQFRFILQNTESSDAHTAPTPHTPPSQFESTHYRGRTRCLTADSALNRSCAIVKINANHRRIVKKMRASSSHSSLSPPTFSPSPRSSPRCFQSSFFQINLIHANRFRHSTFNELSTQGTVVRILEHKSTTTPTTAHVLSLIHI